MQKNKLLFSQDFLEVLQKDPIVLIDVGARGELDPPWNSLSSKHLKIIGFEPDQKECDRLNSSYASANRKYYPYAVWSEDTEININVASTLTCSSVHPPNMEMIKKYLPKHWEPRQTTRLAQMKARKLDSLLDSEDRVDFLKIDTQGAEFEILSGADSILSKDVFAVLVETWTTPVHKNQSLTGDVLNFMQKKGFALFDINTAAAWNRAVSANFNHSGKAQVIGLDLLFFNESVVTRWIAEKQFSRLIKAAAVADVYGFSDFGYEILGRCQKDGAECPSYIDLGMKILVASSSERKSLFFRVKRKLTKLMGKKWEEFPSLHY